MNAEDIIKYIFVLIILLSVFIIQKMSKKNSWLYHKLSIDYDIIILAQFK